jgi:hypothetical protein
MSYYYEDVANRINTGLTKEQEVIDAGWEIVVSDLGRKQANHLFCYDEDFVCDFVTTYYRKERA